MSLEKRENYNQQKQQQEETIPKEYSGLRTMWSYSYMIVLSHRRHTKIFRDVHMAKILREFDAPQPKVFDLMDGQIIGQCDVNAFASIGTKRIPGPFLVRY